MITPAFKRGTMLYEFVRWYSIRCAKKPMKIATFNINNIVKRFAGLAHWLEKTKPNVVCLQEIKCEHAKFPATEVRALDRKSVV